MSTFKPSELDVNQLADDNDVDRFEYFSYIFQHLPMATTLQALEALLPPK